MTVTDTLDAIGTLPAWLVALLDAEAVGRALTPVLPAVLGADGGVRACRVDRIRLKDSTWIGRWDLELDDGSTARVRGDAIAPGAPDPDVPSGSSWVPELRLVVRRDDPPTVGLPAFDELTDAARAAPILEGLIRGGPGDHGTLEVVAAVPEVLSHKPGARATIRYRLELAPGTPAHEPRTVVVKTYRGDKGRDAWAGMRAFWESPLRDDPAVTIAEPLAYDEARRILVQGPIPEERTLKQLLRHALRTGDASANEALRAGLAQAGRGLGAMHASGVSTGPAYTWHDELADVREKVQEIDDNVAGFGASVEPFLEFLLRLEAAHPADPAVPAHRAFRPAQCLVHGRDIGFIDFDGFCQAEPGIDLGLFLTEIVTLTTAELGAGTAEPVIDELSDAFLGGYRERATASPARVALWQSLGTLIELLYCWTKIKPDRIAEDRRLLDRLVERSLLPLA